MRVLVFTLLLTAGAAAADEEQTAVALKAQSDFDRVELAAVPRLPDAIACVQSQAAALPITAHEELSLIHYHKGFCAIAEAVLTHDRGEMLTASAEFDLAISSWPVPKPPKNTLPLPPVVSSALKVLSAIARLETDPAVDQLNAIKTPLAAAVDAPACPAGVMPEQRCRSFIELGRMWLGWIALQQQDLGEASRRLAGLQDSGWRTWTDARRASMDRRYAAAVPLYRRALEQWTASAQWLAPKPDRSDALTALGEAQLFAGDPAGAIRTLDEAVKANPKNAYAIFVRARSRDASGNATEALRDYELASRTALAGTGPEDASGAGRLYRGVWLYRRGDYERAEEEFSAALSSGIGSNLRPDAEAWRYLAAVEQGSCGSSRDSLAKSMQAASDLFPKEQARDLVASCSSRGGGAPAAALR